MDWWITWRTTRPLVRSSETLAASASCAGASEGGKRGGARVIYYNYNSDYPLFALTAYAKNERENLTQADRNDFKALVKTLIESYRRMRE